MIEYTKFTYSLLGKAKEKTIPRLMLTIQALNDCGNRIFPTRKKNASYIESKSYHIIEWLPIWLKHLKESNSLETLLN